MSTKANPSINSDSEDDIIFSIASPIGTHAHSNPITNPKQSVVTDTSSNTNPIQLSPVSKPAVTRNNGNQASNKVLTIEEGEGLFNKFLGAFTEHIKQFEEVRVDTREGQAIKTASGEIRRVDSLAKLILAMNKEKLVCVAVGISEDDRLHVASNGLEKDLREALKDLCDIFKEAEVQDPPDTPASAPKVDKTKKKGVSFDWSIPAQNLAFLFEDQTPIVQKKNRRAARKVLLQLKRGCINIDKTIQDLTSDDEADADDIIRQLKKQPAKRLFFKPAWVKALMDYDENETVAYGIPKTHAEVVLLDMALAQGKKFVVLGIDKLCCMLCAATVTAYSEVRNCELKFGDNVRGTHGLLYKTNWSLPSTLAENSDFFEAFIGPEAAKYYVQMDEKFKKAVRAILRGISAKGTEILDSWFAQKAPLLQAPPTNKKKAKKPTPKSETLFSRFIEATGLKITGFFSPPTTIASDESDNSDTDMEALKSKPRKKIANKKKSRRAKKNLKKDNAQVIPIPSGKVSNAITLKKKDMSSNDYSKPKIPINNQAAISSSSTHEDQKSNTKKKIDTSRIRRPKHRLDSSYNPKQKK